MSTLKLIASDGNTFLVNRYFLQLYTSFYWSLLDDKDEQDIVIIYDDLSSDELTLFVHDVKQKHLCCISNYSATERKPLKTNKKEPIPVPVTESIPNTEEGQITAEPVRCPFHCPKDEHWSNDVAFAHMYTNHYEELSESKYSLSLKRLMGTLKTKLTSKGCALRNCKNKPNVFKSFEGLTNHYKVAHYENTHVCDHCGKTFRSLFKMQKHMRHVEIRNNMTNYMCSYCGKKFTKYLDHRKHISRVHEEKRFVCDQCNRKCGDKKQLVEHVSSVHKHLKPFVCDTCGMKMARLDNLSDHRVKVHGQEKYTMKSYKNIITEGKHPYLKTFLNHKNIV